MTIQNDKLTASSVCEYLKYFFSAVVVHLLILVAFIGISMQYCVLKLHPVGLFILLIFALVLLAYVEALHYACVAVERWDMSAYTEIYPRACKTQALVNTTEKV